MCTRARAFVSVSVYLATAVAIGMPFGFTGTFADQSRRPAMHEWEGRYASAIVECFMRSIVLPLAPPDKPDVVVSLFEAECAAHDAEGDHALRVRP